MREEVLATIFRGDETKAFCVVKPFYCSVCHCDAPNCRRYFADTLMVAGTRKVKGKIQRMLSDGPPGLGGPSESFSASDLRPRSSRGEYGDSGLESIELRDEEVQRRCREPIHNAGHPNGCSPVAKPSRDEQKGEEESLRAEVAVDRCGWQFEPERYLQ
jgi:hypothetical protein